MYYLNYLSNISPNEEAKTKLYCYAILFSHIFFVVLLYIFICYKII